MIVGRQEHPRRSFRVSKENVKTYTEDLSDDSNLGEDYIRNGHGLQAASPKSLKTAERIFVPNIGTKAISRKNLKNEPAENSVVVEDRENLKTVLAADSTPQEPEEAGELPKAVRKLPSSKLRNFESLLQTEARRATEAVTQEALEGSKQLRESEVQAEKSKMKKRTMEAESRQSPKQYTENICGTGEGSRMIQVLDPSLQLPQHPEWVFVEFTKKKLQELAGIVESSLTHQINEPRAKAILWKLMTEDVVAGDVVSSGMWKAVWSVLDHPNPLLANRAVELLLLWSQNNVI